MQQLERELSRDVELERQKARWFLRGFAMIWAAFGLIALKDSSDSRAWQIVCYPMAIALGATGCVAMFVGQDAFNSRDDSNAALMQLLGSWKNRNLLESLIATRRPFALFLRDAATEKHSHMFLVPGGVVGKGTFDYAESSLAGPIAQLIPVFATVYPFGPTTHPTALRFWASKEEWFPLVTRAIRASTVVLVSFDHMGNGLEDELNLLKSEVFLKKSIFSVRDLVELHNLGINEEMVLALLFRGSRRESREHPGGMVDVPDRVLNWVRDAAKRSDTGNHDDHPCPP